MAEKKNAPEAAGAGKNTTKIVLIAVVAVLLLAGVSAAAYYFGTRTSSEGGGAQPAPMSRGGEGNRSGGPMIDIAPFVVNILENRDTRYLKAALTLEVDSEKTAMEIRARMPQVRDTILLLVGNKTYDELRDLQGKLQLRAELVAKLNGLLHAGQISRIYFTDFVVQ